MSEAAPARKEPEAAVAKKAGFSGKIKIGAILAAIVGVQCLLAWFLLPSGHDSAAATETKKESHSSASGKHEIDDTLAERREVDLGKFSITSIDVGTNTTMLIDFHLYGAVLAEHQQASGEAADNGHGDHGKSKDAEPVDNSRFGKLLQQNKHRFRDQVIIIIRNAGMADLSDPALGLIKRQILAKTNSLFGEPLLKEVIFSDFAVVQQ
ncbi:MAG: flagellar basal body-associated FliL family protein [Planctomycetota bacterium]|nr:flagellar basal body-associated FliL family protein [Planctomycetota bacterium]